MRVTRSTRDPNRVTPDPYKPIDFSLKKRKQEEPRLYTRVHVCACVYVCMRACACLYVRVRVCLYLCMCVYMCAYMYICGCTCNYINTYFSVYIKCVYLILFFLNKFILINSTSSFYQFNF